MSADVLTPIVEVPPASPDDSPGFVKALGLALAEGAGARPGHRRLAAGRVERLAAGLHLPRPGHRAAVPLGLHAHRGLLARRRDHPAARDPRLRRRAASSGRSSGWLVARIRVAAARRGLADHRPADDALDRLVPARDPAVRPQRAGHLLRGDPGRGAQHRQRRHQRHRQHPAAVPPPGEGARRPRASTSTGTSCCRPRCPRTSRA